MSIPKIIHYCWFGGNPQPGSVRKYIDTWRKCCPEYQIKEWNESNVDIHECQYIEEAYVAKKWAFVSDYARFCAVYKEGGIYLDTDIEVLRSFDEILDSRAVFGFGREGLTLPVFAAEAGHPCILKVLEDYQKRQFVYADGTYDMTAIEKTVERVLKSDYELKLNGKKQYLRDDILVLPKEFFFARDYETGEIKRYPELFLIHYGDGTWLDENTKYQLTCQHEAVKKFGARFGVPMGKLKFYFDTQGVVGTVKIVVGAIARRIFRKG